MIMIFSQLRARRFVQVFFPASILLLFVLVTIRLHKLPSNIDDRLPPTLTGEPEGYDPKAPPRVLYKSNPPLPPPFTDNFPLAARPNSTADLPPIPAWNEPPKNLSQRSTPLYIGFTRNWRLLQQTVVSYIVAGWPPGEIYVVENTGVMNSNREGRLTLQNPFFLDHHRLKDILGVNVLVTPTLLTFAQLQNFYIWTSLQKRWEHYFWAHMDTVIVSDEECEEDKDICEYKSAYTRAVEVLESTLDPAWGPLATIWFAYDRLALVRTKSFVDVGGWDTMVPFYKTDCDMHERLWMRNFKIEQAFAGKVWDVAQTLEDLGALYQRGEIESGNMGEKEMEKRKEVEKGEVKRNSPAYRNLLDRLDELQNAKSSDEKGRNTWQASQKGGQGEPFYRDSDGFESALKKWMDFGTDVFADKWGRGDCDIRDAGLKDGDEWRVVRDWEEEKVQRQYWREKEREKTGKKKKENEGKR